MRVSVCLLIMAFTVDAVKDVSLDGPACSGFDVGPVGEPSVINCVGYVIAASVRLGVCVCEGRRTGMLGGGI